MRMRHAIACAVLAANAVAVSVANVAAQTYPSRPITVVVPFPAGGPTDTLARILGERLKGRSARRLSSKIVDWRCGHHRHRAGARGARRLHGHPRSLAHACSHRCDF